MSMKVTKEQFVGVTYEELLDENARLRELVTDMCEWAYIDSYCDLRQEFADRMRELGVEASE